MPTQIKKKLAPLTTPYKSKGPPLLHMLSDKKKPKETHTLSRNIDEVVFANHTFKTWYPSWYPKEILGEKTLALAEEGKGTGIVVQTLYICRKCFKYTKDGVEWKAHQDRCERECEEDENGGMRGREMYVKNRGKGVEAGEGRWAVWEVDGARDKVFCQNLSLFAKLFLDTKSVFFDVETFNYFIYVHTDLSTGDKQIIGYFSKEKMSWDHNNLACILVFPPWQKKGLGANLIGLSYSIARREQIMGGPEKPISPMGMKSYTRYWATEIARWLLEDYEESTKTFLAAKEKMKSMPRVTVKDISQGTWISPDDVLNTLREMGVVKKEGKGEECVMMLENVEKWVLEHKVSIQRVVDEEGFLPGYAEKVVE